jgi:hypothetical protein
MADLSFTRKVQFASGNFTDRRQIIVNLEVDFLVSNFVIAAFFFFAIYISTVGYVCHPHKTHDCRG